MLPSQHEEELWDSESTVETSDGSDSTLAYALSESEDEKISAEDSKQPDWFGLLFGAKEHDNGFDEVLSHPEVDTYYENCKLAEDVAWTVINKYHLPVMNSLRNVNCNQVTKALSTMRKSKFFSLSIQEKLLQQILMLDFLACCCQDGNILTLFDNCKRERKIQLLDFITSDLGFLLGSIQSTSISLEQLYSVEKLVDAALKRIPKSSQFSAAYLRAKLNSKIFAFKSEEFNKRKFANEFETNLPVSKNIKLDMARPKSDFKIDKDSGAHLQLKKPKIRTEAKSRRTEGSWEPLSSETHHTPTKDRGEILLEKSAGSSTPKAKKISSHFVDSLFRPDTDDEVTSPGSKYVSKELNQERRQLHYKENDLSKVDLGNKRSISSFKETGVEEGYHYDSDESLPDIPIAVPKKTLTVHSLVRSPYKSNMNTWKTSKYEFSSKSSTSPAKVAVTTTGFRDKSTGRSPLKFSKQGNEDDSHYNNNKCSCSECRMPGIGSSSNGLNDQKKTKLTGCPKSQAGLKCRCPRCFIAKFVKQGKST